MKKFYTVFTTISVLVLAFMNLYLNERLSALNEAESRAAVAESEEQNVAAVMADAPTVAVTPPLYKLGVRNGFVAVYYGNADVVKEMTSFSTEAMPADERLRLSRGIPVYSEEQLAKLLQDYGS